MLNRTHQSLFQNTSFPSTELARSLRALDPSDSLPQNLEQLSHLIAPITQLIPELSSYRLDSPEGQRELPRTATGLILLGSLLRASDALVSLDRPTEISERTLISEALLTEFENFKRPQRGAEAITFAQFKSLVALFQRYANDDIAVSAFTISLVYGDLFKLPHIQDKVRNVLGDALVDHEIALQAAVRDENLVKLADILPSMLLLPQEYQQRIQAEILYGANLGHLLESTTCGAALIELKRHSTEDLALVDFWLLPTLLDVLAARADHTKPETWCGSALGNGSLIEDLLIFAEHLPTLHESDVFYFFDELQQKLSEQSYYEPLMRDETLTDHDKKVIFRLARYFFWKTDNRPLDVLIEGYKQRDSGEKDNLASFFLNEGRNNNTPKPVITYFPYVFSQLYAKHLPEDVALDKTLSTLHSLLVRIEEYELHTAKSTPKTGVRTYAGQEVWFKHLRPIERVEAADAPIRLAIADTDGTPEVILEDLILARNPELRRIFLDVLKGAATSALATCRRELLNDLNSAEQQTFSFVEKHAFNEGAWYRPIHNVIVPQAMISICAHSTASRDLVLAAILHDVGYAGLKIPDTLRGTAWANKDTREAHMAASAVMSRAFLEKENFELSSERIDTLVDIIATHDNPYIGKPLEDTEALLHRDADRAFVISAVSFWKDYLAYLSDDKKLKKFADKGIELTPQRFLRLREGSFSEDALNDMAQFTTFEPMTSPRGEAIAQNQRSERLAEIPHVLAAVSPAAGAREAFEEMLRNCILRDFKIVV